MSKVEHSIVAGDGQRKTIIEQTKLGRDVEESEANFWLVYTHIQTCM